MVLTLFKKFCEIFNIHMTNILADFEICISVPLITEQTTEGEVLRKLSMELRVKILPGLEAKRLRRIIANAGDFTG